LAVVFTPGPSELVAQSHKALAAQEEPLVAQGDEQALGHLAPGCLPAPDWSRRVLDAHQEGYAVVGGSIDVAGRHRPKSLQLWEPGTGRVPNFAEPLLCPSLIPGSEPSWEWSEIEGLPALAHPASEPWLYDGRIVIRASNRMTARRRGAMGGARQGRREPREQRYRGDRGRSIAPHSAARRHSALFC